ncbi:hypothetical protein [Nocardiopsis lambiniae]|uniref:Uncharacterized protein n=1 Tax=Nocardiopsis lambiniae TaxID=3075539 RepID=A0ABU2MAJ8_9ACTN|nr:hypothetical protein [Nocardiopsis sp. DSM 44743]MDT0329634.1 hypothetical protein [Nocardiopsis sp. DSM 44743]
MTLTVIIIAVVVVLAVLLLLLLGMRALNLGSRDDRYEDDDYEYDDAEEGEHAPDEEGHRDDGRDDAPRGRGRRQGGRPERRPERRPKPKARRNKREVDWDDDEDGGFWSSLGGEDVDERGGGRARGERADDRGPNVTAYEYEDEDDGYEDYDDNEASGPAGATTVLPRATGPDPSSDLAVLASLGRNEEPPPVPEDERALPPRPERTELPSAGSSTVPAPAGVDDDPLSSSSWKVNTPPSSDTRSLADRLTAPNTDPSGGAGPLGGPLGTPRDPLGAPSASGSTPPSGTSPYSPSSYDGGRGGSSLDADPLAPGFRGSPSPGSTTGSPIWSSLDTGSHQRPQGGYGAVPGTPGDPLSGGYPAPNRPDPLAGHNTGTHRRSSPYDSGTHTRSPYDTGSHVPGSPVPGDPGAPRRPEYDTGSYTRSEYDTGSYTRPEYDTGTHGRPEDTGSHTRPGYDGGARARPSYDPYDSGTHTRSPYDTGSHVPGSPVPGGPSAPRRPEYDTGEHTRPSYDTGPYTRPEYDTGTHGRRPEDTGSHTRPPSPSPYGPGPSYDTGSHSRPARPGNDPLWGPGEDSFGAPSTPGGYGGPAPTGRPDPFEGGPVPPRPDLPGGPSYGGFPGYGAPTGGHPVDPTRGGAPVPGHGAPTGTNPAYGRPADGPGTPGDGYDDVLGGEYPPRSQEPEYDGYRPLEEWHRPGGTTPDPYRDAPYDQRDRDDRGYDDGYGDGRFR